MTTNIIEKTLLLGCILLCLMGCKTSQSPEVKPAPITKLSGDSELARLIESIRVKEGLIALASGIIYNGRILSIAAAGTRKCGTDNWVTVKDKFLIGSCTKGSRKNNFTELAPRFRLALFDPKSQKHSNSKTLSRILRLRI
jgi:hypothetical protein